MASARHGQAQGLPANGLSGRWRVMAGLLLTAALATQISASIQLAGYWSSIQLAQPSTRAATVLTFVMLATTLVAAILSFIGRSAGALVLAALTLLIGVWSSCLFILGDLQNQMRLADSFKGEVLGVLPDGTGALSFWPSIFSATVITWILLTAALIVLCLRERNVVRVARAHHPIHDAPQSGK